MKVFTRVALIGFGEVGQTLAADLKRINFPEITAYDPLFEVKESGPAKALTARTVMAAPDAIAAVSNAELVISCVTAAQDIEAAKSVAPGLPSGAYYLDVNSVSPAMKQACARVINEAGGNYVEAAVMSPIAGKRIASPMLLGGAFAEDFLERAKPIGFTGATVPNPTDLYDSFNVTPVWVTQQDQTWVNNLGPYVSAISIPVSYAGVLQSCDTFLNAVNYQWSLATPTPSGSVDVQTALL